MNDEGDWPKRRLGLFAVLFLLALVSGVVASGGLTGMTGYLLTPPVTSEYDTHADAVADDLFDRGWLPDIIPASARDIVTTNNLDLDMSHGRFGYDRADHAAFLSRLQPLQSGEARSVADPEWVAELAANGYRAYEFTYGESDRERGNTGSVWVFFVHEGKGHVFYEKGPR